MTPIEVGGGTFIGNQINCPKCGKWANLLDGTFVAVGDALRVISGPQITSDILRRLRMLAEEAAEGTESSQAVVAAAREANPELGSLISKWMPHGISFVALMLAALQTYLMWQEGSSDAKFRASQSAQMERLAEAMESAAKQASEKPSGADDIRHVHDRRAGAQPTTEHRKPRPPDEPKRR